MIPLGSEGLIKYLFQWGGMDGGQYFSLNYYPYYVLYKTFEFFGINIYLSSSIIIFSLRYLSGYGIYKLLKILTNQKDKYLLIPVLFYLLSPSLLNASYYLYAYSFTPWFLFYVVRALKSERVNLGDILGLSASLFFLSLNLPNPKYIFHTILISFLLILSFKLFKITKPINKGKYLLPILFLGISSYLIAPQVAFLSQYTPQKYDVHIKKDYKDIGPMMDYDESNLLRVFKIHKDSLNLNGLQKNLYLNSNVVTISNYLIFLSIIFIHIFAIKRKVIYTTIFNITLLYIFFFSGPNPPLGYLYEKWVENFSELAFLRTTSGTPLFLSLLFALLLTELYYLGNRHIRLFLSLILFLIILINGYPLLTGEIYKNVSVLGESKTDINSRGIIIPEEYFEAQKLLSNYQDDKKILFITPQYGYIVEDWGYFGVSIYDFIYTKGIVDCQRILHPMFSNIGYIFEDKKSEYRKLCPYILKGALIVDNEILRIQKLDDDYSLSHIYIPNEVLSIDDFNSLENNKFLKPVFVRHQELKTSFNKLDVNRAELKYKKIDQSQFEINLFKVNSSLPLVLNENFNHGWKLALIPNDFKEGSEFLGSLVWPKIGKSAHFSANMSANSSSNLWMLNINDICGGDSEGYYCYKNSDGTVNLRIRMYFQPDIIYKCSIALSVFLFFIVFIFYIFKKPKNASL